MYNIGQLIKVVREYTGLSRQQLADKTGLAAVTIGQYERGARHPKESQIKLVADALGVPVDAFSEKVFNEYFLRPEELSSLDASTVRSYLNYAVSHKESVPFPNAYGEYELAFPDESDKGSARTNMDHTTHVKPIVPLSQSPALRGENREPIHWDSIPTPDERYIPGVDDDYEEDDSPEIELGEDVGENIRRLRQAARMTQKQLADKIGVALVTIQQYESGRRRPRVAQLQRLAEVFGMSAYSLAPSTRFTWIAPEQEGARAQEGKEDSKERTSLQVEVAYLEKYHGNQWLSLMTQDGKEKLYFAGRLSDILYKLTPEAIELITAFAEFMQQRESEYFRKEQ